MQMYGGLCGMFLPHELVNIFGKLGDSMEEDAGESLKEDTEGDGSSGANKPFKETFDAAFSTMHC